MGKLIPFFLLVSIHSFKVYTGRSNETVLENEIQALPEKVTVCGDITNVYTGVYTKKEIVMKRVSSPPT